MAAAANLLLVANAPQARAAGSCQTISANYTVCTTTGGAADAMLFYDAAARVNNAPAGSVIQIAMYQWHAVPVDPLLDALRSAVARGVGVHVLLGNKSGSNDPTKPGIYDTLYNAIGPHIAWCGPDYANRACLRRTANDGLMHAKFMLIRHPSGHTEVTTLSSNITWGQYAKAQNSVSVVGDAALYNAYAQYWDRMVRKDWDGWTTDGHLAHDGLFGGNKAYFFPRASGDPLAGIIDGKHCATSGEQIRVLSSDDDFRPSVRTALQNAKRRGCFIRITVSNTAAKNNILNSPNNNITASQINVREENHNKIVYIRARASASDPLEEVVFTGSHNVGQNGLINANDVMSRVKDVGVTTAYRNYVLGFQPS